MTDEEKLDDILKLINDYREELLKDQDSMDNLMYLLGRFMTTGEDMTREEMNTLYDFLQERVKAFIRRAH